MIGSVRVDGDVGDQVVSVLGSVDLGRAVVAGTSSASAAACDAPGSRVGGAVTEVSLADARWDPRFQPWLREVGLISMFDGFSGVPRLVGTMFSCCCSYSSRRWPWWLRAPPWNDPPSGSATIRSGRRWIGLLAEVMFLPVLVLTCVVLAISVVGIRCSCSSRS